MKTLIAMCSDHIGQMDIETAKKEVVRMNNQTDSNKWHMDFSEQKFSPDETDDDVLNPCPLRSGYCWVTCSDETEDW